MELHFINPDNLAVFIGHDEIEKFSENNGEKGDSGLVRLVKGLVNSVGSLSGEKSMEIDSFEYCGKTAVFVHMKEKLSLYNGVVMFSDLESLLGGAGCVSAMKVRSSLYLYEDNYCLAFAGRNFGRAARRACEFGVPAAEGAGFLLHIMEHGKLLIKDNAVETLLKSFGENFEVEN